MYFDEIPNDKDTEVLFNQYITIHGLLAVQQQWKWDGIIGLSVIVPTEALVIIPEEWILKEIGSYQLFDQEITKSETDGFIFYNYQFIH